MITHSITEADWRAWFKPHAADDTGGFRTYGYQTDEERALLARMHAERRLWTYCCTAVGNPYIRQGLAFVDREFYIVCDVAYDEGAEFQIEHDWLYCEDCGNWFDDECDDEDAVPRSERTAYFCVHCEGTSDA